MLTTLHTTHTNRFSGYIRHKQDSSYLGTNTVYLKGEVTESNTFREKEFLNFFKNLMEKILKNPKKYKRKLDQNEQGFSFEKGQIRYQLLTEPSGKALQIETPEAIEAIGTYCKPFTGLCGTVANWQTKVKNRSALNRTINQF